MAAEEFYRVFQIGSSHSAGELSSAHTLNYVQFVPFFHLLRNAAELELGEPRHPPTQIGRRRASCGAESGDGAQRSLCCSGVQREVAESRDGLMSREATAGKTQSSSEMICF